IMTTAFDARDIEAPVVALAWAVLIEDHAGSNGGFGVAVADIKAFQPLRRVFQIECIAQRLEAFGQLGLVGELCGQLLLCIGTCQFPPLRPMTTHFLGDTYTSSGMFAKCTSDQFGIRYRVAGQHLAGNLPRLTQVIMADEHAEKLSFAQIETIAGAVMTSSQQASLTNGQDRY